MEPSLAARLALLTTPHLADASLRVGIEPRVLPPELRTAQPGARFAGRAVPARHVGSVDVILEALERAQPGDVLVVDDAGRRDRASIGDLVALEAQAAGLGGILLWGLHRDSAELLEIGLPVMSLGSSPWGPLSVESRPADALECAWVGEVRVTAADVVVADTDGALVIPLDRLDDIVTQAEIIRETEGRQAEVIRGGRSLRDQVRFEEFLTKRSADPSWGFRDHLRQVGGEIEV